MLKGLWAYRGFILGSVQREFQIKYRNSMLGAAWTVLNPLAMILVYTLIFAKVMQAKLPDLNNEYAYSIYLCAGIFTWGLFAEITSRAQNVFLEHANLIKKISFPRICLPMIVVLSALLNFAIIFTLFSLFLIGSGNFPGWQFVAILPLLLLQIMFAIGLGMVLAVLNVFFRDVGQFFTIFLQFWFWLTPIVYPASVLPAELQGWIALNPMAALVRAYQTVLVHGTWPDWASLMPLAALGAGLCVMGVLLFRRRSGEMVDEL
jgi:lipopolysaccharide transport system permease protein